MVKVLKEIKFWLKDVITPLFVIALSITTKISKKSK